MNVVAAVIAVVFILVIAGRLLHRPRTVGESDHGFAIPGGSVGAFIAAVNRFESEQHPEYLAAVRALRADGNATPAIAAAYVSAAPELRLSLLLAAGQAGPAARAFLAAAAAAPLRPDAGIADLVEESRLRLIALDGLERLALDGSAEAWRDIEGLAYSADRAVKIGAVAALKSGSKTDALARLRDKLDPQDRYVFDVARPNVRDIPQVFDPTLGLSRFAAGSRARPHPDAAQMGHIRKRDGRRGSPSVQGRGDG